MLRERDGGVDSFASAPPVFTWAFFFPFQRQEIRRASIAPPSVNICLTAHPYTTTNRLGAQCMLGKSVPSAALLPACQQKQAAANRNLERFRLWIEQVNEKYFKMTRNMSVHHSEEQVNNLNCIF